MLDVDRVVLNFWKDMRAARPWFLLMTIFGIMLMIVVWIAIASATDARVERDDIPNLVPGLHAYVAIICSVAFLAAAHISYYSEIQNRTLQPMPLHDLSLNDISIMKIISSSAIGVLFAYLFVNLTFLPFMGRGGGLAFLSLQAVLFSTCFCFILMTIAAVYMTHIIHSIMPFVKFRPTAIHGFMMYVSFFMTETFFRMVASWSNLPFNSDRPPLWATGMYFSPVHMSGRMAGAMLDITTMDASIAVIPLFLGIIFLLGFFGTERSRLEMFLR